MTPKEQAKAAKKFAEFWKDKGNEKQESQKFWYSLLSEVFGIKNSKDILHFEEPVKLSHTSYKDVWIDSTRVLIEQKGAKIDLYKKEKQSDGKELTPYEQAKRYDDKSPFSLKARWIIVCNFQSFLIHDMNKEQPEKDPLEIRLENFEKDYKYLQFIVDGVKNFIQQEEEISVKAGEIVGKIYDALINLYHDPNSEKTQKSLNILCVRLVFCLYAEDAGLFGKHNAFHDYLADFSGKHARKALIELFNVLNTNYKERDEYLEPELASFPYVNGGLFAEKNVEIPQFTDEVLQLILEEGSERFDWSQISPTIFGAVFESTLNPDTRRKGGMHYTSLKNIHKVIDPLFLDELKVEFNEIIAERPIHTVNALSMPSMKEMEKRRVTNKADREYVGKMKSLQDKLSRLTFFDPACGSGNFLTETYISLRHLENKIIAETELYAGGSQLLGFTEEEFNPIKVSITQFYGIEVNDFAVTVAKTALWIAESQMLEETIDIIHRDLDFFPLKTNAYIHEGNALEMDWQKIIQKDKLSYIIGNPPFLGFTYQSDKQKDDMQSLFPKVKNLDYVCAWYKMASDYIQGTNIEVCFVSTNSITQGETASRFWPFLNVRINFAYRTFPWESESNGKAHVHCVIIGFACFDRKRKIIYRDGVAISAKNINAYLLDGPDILVKSINKPLCHVPEMVYGNKPADGGNLIIEDEDLDDFIKNEPQGKKFIKPLLGAVEFLHGKKRWCLWLEDASPAELSKCPRIRNRVKKCREMRLSSKAKGIQKFADTPTLFAQITQPADKDYIIVPLTTSEKRRYIPMGFMDSNTKVTNAISIIPGAGLFEFGILSSNVHCAWMRAVAGRLKSDYRYSKDVVYNSFPWPYVEEKIKGKIISTAKEILNAREKHSDSTLAQLYDEEFMPDDLKKAHKANDKAVMQAYGFWGKFTSNNKEENEIACVTELMKLYQNLLEIKSK